MSDAGSPKAAEAWRALRTCADCEPPRQCVKTFITVPDIGASRIYLCQRHGPVSIEMIVRTGIYGEIDRQRF